MSSSRLGFRFFQNSRAAFRNGAGPFRRPGAQGFRFQSSDAASEQQSTFRRMWDSPIGIKTVHFWYGLVKCFPIKAIANYRLTCVGPLS